MKKILSILTVLLISLMLFGACTPEAAEPDARSITVVDHVDREITVEGNVEKIVSLAPSHTEILFALGLGDKIAGVTDYCNYPAEANDIEKMGDFSGPNVEVIVAAAPDVVFTTMISQETVETLEQAGINVIVVNPMNFENVYDGIEIIGLVCGVEDAASALVEEMKASLAAVSEAVSAVAAEDRKVIYYEIWHDPPTTVGPNTFLNELMETAGTLNLAADADTDWPTYSSEVILEKDPDVILMGHGGQSAEDVAGRPGWDAITAVTSDSVAVVDPDIFSRPGPRIVDAVEFLAEYAYPELFSR